LRYLRFEPLQRELSRIVLGTLGLSSDTLDESYALLDAWVDAGGNVIDTAHSYGFAAGYGFGDCERVLGRWLEDRPGTRDGLVIISKGGHPNAERSRVTPEDVTCDLRDSMARLHGPVDIYLLHRDDPSVNVGPLIEVLNEHRATGRLAAFGASNWTIPRIEEANAYAAARGLEGFCCSSPHLSLATQNEEPWPGTVSAADAASRAWHERTGMPLFAWSSQARGFFTGSERPAIRTPKVRRVYSSEPNLERYARAAELARRTGRTANDIALAWVLHQPFPTYAVIGPHSVSELRSSLGALEVELTSEEVRWLNLESD
jgi:1-deoxyxylulose-5-phosphate synthase